VVSYPLSVLREPASHGLRFKPLDLKQLITSN